MKYQQTLIDSVSKHRDDCRSLPKLLTAIREEFNLPVLNDEQVRAIEDILVLIDRPYRIRNLRELARPQIRRQAYRLTPKIMPRLSSIWSHPMTCVQRFLLDGAVIPPRSEMRFRTQNGVRYIAHCDAGPLSLGQLKTWDCKRSQDIYDALLAKAEHEWGAPVFERANKNVAV